MKVYILIPQAIFDSFSRIQLNWFTEDFSMKLKSYFGKTDVVPVRKSNISSFDIYFMGKPNRGIDYNDAKEHVIELIKQKIGDQIGVSPNVTTNYSAFNPDFNPESDKKTQNTSNDSTGVSEYDYEKLSMNYHAVEPRYTFDQVVLPAAVLEKIEEAIGIIEVESKVFDEWGLRSIIPVATSALSFYGPPGTGKSMAAEAVAKRLGKRILSASYADIESKYHGEGPKMVKAIFKAAENDDAVLFLDESDSLLSKRLTNVTDGSAQAINSMRSQLLISLEQFRGIVIFATNLVINYDKAFLSRLINIQFTYPDTEEREKIWWNHLKSKQIHVPLDDDINIRRLAEDYDFCGREIKNAVKSACIAAALAKREKVSQLDFVKACDKTLAERVDVLAAHDHTSIG